MGSNPTLSASPHTNDVVRADPSRMPTAWAGAVRRASACPIIVDALEQRCIADTGAGMLTDAGSRDLPMAPAPPSAWLRRRRVRSAPADRIRPDITANQSNPVPPAAGQACCHAPAKAFEG